MQWEENERKLTPAPAFSGLGSLGGVGITTGADGCKG